MHRFFFICIIFVIINDQKQCQTSPFKDTQKHDKYIINRTGSSYVQCKLSWQVRKVLLFEGLPNQTDGKELGGTKGCKFSCIRMSG